MKVTGADPFRTSPVYILTDHPADLRRRKTPEITFFRCSSQATALVRQQNRLNFQICCLSEALQSQSGNTIAQIICFVAFRKPCRAGEATDSPKSSVLLPSASLAGLVRQQIRPNHMFPLHLTYPAGSIQQHIHANLLICCSSHAMCGKISNPIYLES